MPAFALTRYSWGPTRLRSTALAAERVGRRLAAIVAADIGSLRGANSTERPTPWRRKRDSNRWSPVSRDRPVETILIHDSLARGTEGSNRPRSSGESIANLFEPEDVGGAAPHRARPR